MKGIDRSMRGPAAARPTWSIAEPWAAIGRLSALAIEATLGDSSDNVRIGLQDIRPSALP